MNMSRFDNLAFLANDLSRSCNKNVEPIRGWSNQPLIQQSNVLHGYDAFSPAGAIAHPIIDDGESGPDNDPN